MSATTNTVDVLLIVDADLLRQTNNVEKSVSLVTQRSQVDPNATDPTEQDGGYELWIDVKKGDNIRWRATTLSRNFDTSAVITNVYKGNPQNGNTGDIAPPELQNYPEVRVPFVQSAGNPPTFGYSPATVTFWQTNARKEGKVWYVIEFYLLDQQAKPLNSSPYSWDPYITVTL